MFLQTFPKNLDRFIILSINRGEEENRKKRIVSKIPPPRPLLGRGEIHKINSTFA